jgi:hypothetical protein
LDTSRWPGARTLLCDLKEFLHAPLLHYEGHTATVADVIRACANAKGGIHFGPVKEGSQELVLQWDNAVKLLGREPSLTAISGISRIALDGLLPIAKAMAPRE